MSLQIQYKINMIQKKGFKKKRKKKWWWFVWV